MASLFLIIYFSTRVELRIEIDKKKKYIYISYSSDRKNLNIYFKIILKVYRKVYLIYLNKYFKRGSTGRFAGSIQV